MVYGKRTVELFSRRMEVGRRGSTLRPTPPPHAALAHLNPLRCKPISKKFESQGKRLILELTSLPLAVFRRHFPVKSRPVGSYAYPQLTANYLLIVLHAPNKSLLDHIVFFCWYNLKNTTINTRVHRRLGGKKPSRRTTKMSVKEPPSRSTDNLGSETQKRQPSVSRPKKWMDIRAQQSGSSFHNTSGEGRRTEHKTDGRR